jgi:hypothetical protein
MPEDSHLNNCSVAHLNRNLNFRRLRVRRGDWAKDKFLLAAAAQNLPKTRPLP